MGMPKFEILEEDELEFKDGDDGGGGETEISNINIRRVDNGWIINVTFQEDEDEIEETLVVQDGYEGMLLMHLAGWLGVDVEQEEIKDESATDNPNATVFKLHKSTSDKSDKEVD